MDWLIASLAVWRVSRFIRKENGPKCFMARLRSWICRRFCKPGNDPDGTMAELVSCNKCSSFWLGVLATVIWLYVDPYRWTGAIWFAMPWALSASTYAWEYADEIAAIHAKENYQLEQQFDATYGQQKDL